MRVLTVNAGSSSLKLRLVGSGERVLDSADLTADRGRADPEKVRAVLSTWPRPDAVGHRFVHGGTAYRDALPIDSGVIRGLRALTDLAPVHQPKSLIAYEIVTGAVGGVPAVACFDTAFHATMPDAASTYAVPRVWREEFGVRRFGFHGLSHSWAAHRAAELLGHDGARLVVAHLGAGCSLCAVVGERSVETTMGFTPLDGLVMATRSGAVDPSLVLWLQTRKGLSALEIGDALENESGLLALSGTADMRDVLSAALSQDDGGAAQGARLALRVFVHHVVTGVGAMAAAAGGLDALVFTGGVGEHAAVVRELVAVRLGHLGVHVDPDLNFAADRSADDQDIRSSGAEVATLVVHAREDLQIARETRSVLVGV